MMIVGTFTLGMFFRVAAWEEMADRLLRKARGFIKSGVGREAKLSIQGVVPEFVPTIRSEGSIFRSM